MSQEQAGQLNLFGAAHWRGADGVRHDLPDSLPGYLLAYLAGGRWVARAELAAEFWPTRSEKEALGNLRSNLHRVREALSVWGRPEALSAEPRRVRIAVPTDVGEFRAALARNDWVSAAALQGDSLLRSLSFRGFARVDEWAAGERRELAAAWRSAALKAARLYAQGGEAERATALLLRLLQEELGNEPALQELLRLAASAGRRGEALAAFERYRDWLHSELKLEPSPETTALVEALGHSGAGGRRRTPVRDAAADVPLLLLFGPPTLRAAGAVPMLPERRCQMLVVLAVHAGQWVSREHVAALLWPEQSAADGRRNLRHALFKARELPGTEGLEANEHALRWRVATDVLEFRAALKEQRLGDALQLRRGPLAVGMDDPGNRAFAEWIAAERARTEAQWRQAALEHLQALREPARRIAVAETLLQADPLDEAAFAALLAAELALEHRARAQRLYRDYAARLVEELGVDPPQHLRDLLAGLPSIEAGAFVGRRVELAELATLLQQPDCRLVTILGPGGIGKSSLARQAMKQAEARFTGGVVWIELQDLDEASSVLARLAGQLNLAINDAQDPLPQLARHLQDRRTLAFLDNAEHLTGLAPLLDRLLDEATALSIVLTSRTRMNGRHERVLPLGGLPVPDDESRDLQSAATFDAVRLFDLRASAAQRGFSLARQLPSVIRIVETVGGLPLAIELAAGWVRLLPAEEIARDLRDAIEVLERDPTARGAPARPEHASLRAVLERSWQMLGPAERDAMLGLSVFRGGFTHAAAKAVADVPLPLVSSLVDKSVLTLGEAGRFVMHPLLATFASERAAAEPARLRALRARHADYFARLLMDLAPHARADHRVLVEGVEGEFANAVAAWNAASAARRADLIEMMAAPLGAYFDHRGRYGEGAAVLRTALDLAEADTAAKRALARVRSAMANLLHRRRDLDEALAIAQAGARLAEASGDRQTLIGCLSHAGSCLSVLGRWTEARPCFERALALALEEGDRPGIAASLMNLGVCAKKDGLLDEALDLYTRSLEQERELAHHAAVGRCLNNIGVLHMERDDWRRAREFMAEGVRHCERYKLKSLLPYVTNGLGLSQYEIGDLDEAERCFLRAIDLARATEVRVVEQTASCFVARVAARRGRFDEARSRFREAARLAVAVNSVPDLLDVAMYYAEVLRDSGDRVGAFRTWQMVFSHERAEAGVRGSSEKWAKALALTAAERSAADREPLTLDRFVGDLTA